MKKTGKMLKAVLFVCLIAVACIFMLACDEAPKDPPPQEPTPAISVTVAGGSVYDGTAQEPTVTVKDGETTLTVGTDYTLEYSNNVNVGLGKVAVTFIGTYAGEQKVEKQFDIAVKTITPVVENIAAVTYDGTAKMPALIVKDGETLLTAGTDYDVEYANNVNAGTGKATVTLKGNYSGSAEKEFTINKFDASQATVQIADVVFGQTPIATVTLENFTLVLGEDYDVDYGNYSEVNDSVTATVTFKGNFCGTATATYAVEALEIDATVVLSEPTAVYYFDGFEKRPAIVVSDENVVLTENEDYEISYQDNINAGTARINVQMIGSYAGSTYINFEIKAKEVVPTIEDVPAQTYTALGIEPNLTVRDGNIVLIKNVDYTVVYENNVNVGSTAKAIVTLKDNYKGRAEKVFTINAKDASAAVVSVQNIKYGQTPNAEVQLTGFTFTSADYEVNYGDYSSVNASITATVTFKGNFCGTATATYAVEALEIDATVELVNPSEVFTYNKEEKKPAVLVRNSGTVLTAETDYDVAYSNNANAGNATITVTLKGNYSGNAYANFTIEKATVNEPEADDTVFNYDGTEKEYAIVSNPLYTVQDNVQTEAGTHIVKIKLADIDNYKWANADSSDDLKYEFVINAKELTEVSVASLDAMVATGEELIPTLTVKDGSKELEKGKDYAVVFANNIYPGTATATISFIGNYKGENVVKNFTITPNALDSASDFNTATSYPANVVPVISADGKNATFDGNGWPAATINKSCIPVEDFIFKTNVKLNDVNGSYNPYGDAACAIGFEITFSDGKKIIPTIRRNSDDSKFALFGQTADYVPTWTDITATQINKLKTDGAEFLMAFHSGKIMLFFDGNAVAYYTAEIGNVTVSNFRIMGYKTNVTLSDMTIIEMEERTYSGKVADSGSNGISGATVTVVSCGVTKTATTAEDGTFSVTGIPAGNIAVTITPANTKHNAKTVTENLIKGSQNKAEVVLYTRTFTAWISGSDTKATITDEGRTLNLNSFTGWSFVNWWNAADYCVSDFTLSANFTAREFTNQGGLQLFIDMQGSVTVRKITIGRASANGALGIYDEANSWEEIYNFTDEQDSAFFGTKGIDLKIEKVGQEMKISVDGVLVKTIPCGDKVTNIRTVTWGQNGKISNITFA